MPKIQISYNTGMTAEKLKDIFTQKFPQYRIVGKGEAMVFGIDFALIKTSWTGIAVRYIVKPKKEEAYISFNAFTPSTAARFFLNGLIPMIILMTTSWRKMTNEVREFIKNSPDIKAM